jgi:prepilin-type N-terminal cleavage/methylation domain-containing protein
MTPRSHRTGFTLFEMVLVLAIMVILAGITYPSIKGMFGYYKLHGGVDSVRAAWAHARGRAIEESRPYRFAVEPNGSHFRVAPDQPDYWSGSAPSSDPHGAGTVMEKSLPAGVHFAIGDASPAPAAENTSKGDDSSPPSGEWTPAVVFLPDGTAREDVTMTFQVHGVRPVALYLRGLTGVSSTQTVKP